MTNRKVLTVVLGVAVLAGGGVLVLRVFDRTTKIADIIANPEQFKSHSVTISCVASGTIVPDVWDKFTCADATGTLMVVTKPPGPGEGARVNLRGRVCFTGGLMTWFCEDGSGVPGMAAP